MEFAYHWHIPGTADKKSHRECRQKENEKKRKEKQKERKQKEKKKKSHRECRRRTGVAVIARRAEVSSLLLSTYAYVLY
jgi:hypothetical protein